VIGEKLGANPIEAMVKIQTDMPKVSYNRFVVRH
jgi:hypothetical protein